jgi:hypothetical protein
MRLSASLLFLFLQVAAFSQTVFIKNLENQNLCGENYDSETNTVVFKPRKDSLNTCAVWFYFGMTGFRKDTVLTFQGKFDESNFTPCLPVYSYDNEHFFPVKNASHGKRLLVRIKPEKDTVYFATGFPYSYSRLKKFLGENSESKNLRKTENLDTSSKFYVPLLTITSQKDSRKKRLVWIICRQHAFESVADYVLEGMLKYLLSENCDKKLLKRYVFKIVPLFDAESVVSGQTGRMSKPRDYNRDWDSPVRSRTQCIEKQIEKTAGEYNYFMFFDVHGTYPCGSLSGKENFSYFDLQGNFHKSAALNKYFSMISSVSFRSIADSQQSYGGLTADWWNFLNFKELKFSTTVEIDWVENIETYYKIGEEMIKALRQF